MKWDSNMTESRATRMGWALATLLMMSAPRMCAQPFAPATLPSGIVGQPYANTQISVVDSTETFMWSISPQFGLSIIPGLGATATIGGIPTIADTFTVTVTAVRPGTTPGYTYNYTVTIYPPASLILTLPAITTPSNQVTLQIEGPAMYPAPITGHLQLHFDGSPDLKANLHTQDPGLSLSKWDFDLSTNPAIVLLQPGTSAGTVTVRAINVKVGGIDIGSAIAPAITVVDSSPPVIINCTQDRTGPALGLSVTGYSPTREVTRATFLFSPANGSDLSTTRIVRDDAGTALFVPYYSSQYSAFSYDQTFVVNGSMNAIGSVSVWLDNSKGSSQTTNCN
jgi:hypothetical protein